MKQKPTTKTVVKPVATCRRKTLSDKTAEAWLESFNPLRYLTIQRAQMIFDAARRGNDVRLQWIYANIEQTDPTLTVCAERRAGALVDLDFTIRPKPATRVRGYDEGLAKEQTAFLDAVFGQAEERGLWEAVEHLASAFFRGHAHVVPHFSQDGLSVSGFELLDGWNVCRDLVTGFWHWNPAASETLDFKSLQRIPAGEMITLVKSRHIDYPAMAIYLRSALGESAWGRFLERYGVPPVIITMPPDMDPGKVSEYATAAEHVAEGGTGALPHGSNVFYATEARGTNPFKEFLQHQQELIVLMATGGMLTSLTGATGIGQGATSAHEETWRMIVRRDAKMLASAINRTLTDVLLDRAFPGKPHLASFDFETDPPASAGEIFDLASKAVAAGYKVEKAELEERTGYRLMEAQSDVTSPGMAYDAPPRHMFNKAPAPSKDKALKALARSLQLDLTSAAEALEAFFEHPSAAAAQVLQARLPELLPDDPQSALILEQALAEAYGDAIEDGVEKVEEVVGNMRPSASALGNGECRARDPSKCRTHGNHPGEGQREREKKGDKDSLGKKFNPEHPELFTVKDNIERGERAIKRALSQKRNIHDAMYRPECGSIDFIWGSDSTYGIAHAFAGHPKDIEKLPEIIAKGEAYQAKSPGPDGKKGYYGRIAFVYGKGAVFVDPQPKKKSLLVTGYAKSGDDAFEKVKKGPKV